MSALSWKTARIANSPVTGFLCRGLPIPHELHRTGTTIPDFLPNARERSMRRATSDGGTRLGRPYPRPDGNIGEKSLANLQESNSERRS